MKLSTFDSRVRLSAAQSLHNPSFDNDGKSRAPADRIASFNEFYQLCGFYFDIFEGQWARHFRLALATQAFGPSTPN